MSYYRHSAFEGRFVRYGSDWYLQITPNYHFTRDGDRLSRYAPDLVSGIKRLENGKEKGASDVVTLWPTAGAPARPDVKRRRFQVEWFSAAFAFSAR